MFLLEPGETAYDLKWRMFGVDVRVHPMFWLVSAIMGFGWLRDPEDGYLLFAIWIGCVFFSILIHELGHVFMFRMCGAEANVVLYAFGGLAIPDRRLRNRWQRIAVSFAGPFAEFLIIAVICFALALGGTDRVEGAANLILNMAGVRTTGTTSLGLEPLVEITIFFLFLINLFFGILNLLPIFPLDGGQISRDFLDGMLPGGQGTRMALGISLVLAGILTVHCLFVANGKVLLPFLPAFGGGYTAMMFGMLAVQSYQMLQHESNPPWRRED